MREGGEIKTKRKDHVWEGRNSAMQECLGSLNETH